MIDLQERFDRAWAGEPAHLDVARRLADGHRRLRRRRTAIGAGVLGVVAVLGGATVTGTLPGFPDRVQVAASSPGHHVRVATRAEAAALDPNLNAGYSTKGELFVRPGWRVTERIDAVYLGEADRAVALEIREDGTDAGEWYFLSWDAASGTSAVVRSWPQANVGMTLREWAPDEAGNRSGRDR